MFIRNVKSERSNREKKNTKYTTFEKNTQFGTPDRSNGWEGTPCKERLTPLNAAGLCLSPTLWPFPAFQAPLLSNYFKIKTTRAPKKTLKKIMINKKHTHNFSKLNNTKNTEKNDTAGHRKHILYNITTKNLFQNKTN